MAYEAARSAAQATSRVDPWLKRTARRSHIALATTAETAQKMRALGACDVRVLSQVALTDAEFETLGAVGPLLDRPVRFISMGRLLHLKGFHLGLRAFARCRHSTTEYWIVGDGPARRRLEKLSRRLGVADRVRFCGELPQADAFAALAKCHVLVHPSLHDSGGMVVAEALAAGRPAIVLDTGRPALQVTPEC